MVMAFVFPETGSGRSLVSVPNCLRSLGVERCISRDSEIDHNENGQKSESLPVMNVKYLVQRARGKQLHVVVG